jgi:hypothetical protein
MINFKWTLTACVFLPILGFGEITTNPETGTLSFSTLYINDTLNSHSVNLKFPGLFYNSQQNHEYSIGYGSFPVSADLNFSQPTTDFDNNDEHHNSPYVNLTIPISTNITSGVYLGDVFINTTEFNRNRNEDSLKHFRSNKIGVTGNMWVAFNNPVIKGLSLSVKGTYFNRDVTFQTSEEWKSLNTDYKYKLKSGYGSLSALFAINNMHYLGTRFEFGQNNTTTRNSQHDTLFFSKDAYINDSLINTSAIKEQVTGVQFDYTFKPASGIWLFGLNIHANRMALDYSLSKGDSTIFSQKLFIQKKTTFDQLSFCFGAEIDHNIVFYNRSENYIGYIDLLKKYGKSRYSDFCTFQVPFIAILHLRQNLDIFCGTTFEFNTFNSNYSFISDTKLISSESGYFFDFIPLGIRYSTKKGLSLSFSPSVKKGLFLGNLELNYSLGI